MSIDRIESHLLLRLRRRSMRAACRATEAADLLVSQHRDVEGMAVIVYGPGPRLFQMTSTDDTDRERLLRMLSREALRPHLALPLTEDAAEALVIRDLIEDGMVVDGSDKSDANDARSTGIEVGFAQDKPPSESEATGRIIRLLNGIASPPSVVETAICLCLTEAARRAHLPSADVLEAIARPAPFVCIRVPIRGFEKTFGLMREHGVFGRPLTLRDGSGGYSLSHRLHSNHEPCGRTTAVTFSTKDLDGAGELTPFIWTVDGVPWVLYCTGLRPFSFILMRSLL